jgi:hypothetical protein
VVICTNILGVPVSTGGNSLGGLGEKLHWSVDRHSPFHGGRSDKAAKGAPAWSSPEQALNENLGYRSYSDQKLGKSKKSEEAYQAKVEHMKKEGELRSKVS